MLPAMEIALVLVGLVALIGVLATAYLARRLIRGDGERPGERIAGLSAQIAERDRQIDEVRAERDAARRDRDAAQAAGERARLELAQVRADHAARNEELAKAQAQIETRFKGLAAEVLKVNSETLRDQTTAHFAQQLQVGEAELEKRQQAVAALVKPVRDHLDKFEKQVNAIEQKREGAYEGLKVQIGRLQDVTGSLSEALRSPQIRGQWGEQQLRNILQLSGLKEGVDFEQQVTTAADDEGARRRPDVVVRIPGGVHVVIDAKTPLSAYLDAHNAADAQQQEELLQRHAKSLGDRVKELGDKDYTGTVPVSPDFVVMFLPTEAILEAAMEVQPSLWEDAWQKHHVLIATPGLLVAFLRTVALAWQRQDMQENAQQISDEARRLYESLQVYAGHVGRVGKGLQQALSAYNDSIGSLEGRVLVRARRFEELGPAASAAKRIDVVAPIDQSVRLAAAPELAAGDERADAAGTAG